MALAVGCGGGEPDPEADTEDEVFELIGAEPSSSGTQSVGTCSVPIVLIGDSQIETYESAGDTVVKNPSETVGVKVTESECEGKVATALENVP